MPALAITGMIGSGKSTALSLLLESLATVTNSLESFSADEENRRLLDEDPNVQDEICDQLGNDCYLGDGKVNRARIFQIITSDMLAKVKLERILHPRLENLWKPRANRFRSQKDAFFVAEIPLLYEKGLESFFDRILLIGCSDGVRRGRLEKHRSMPSSDATQWENLQNSQESKIPKADYLLWNDGSRRTLSLQIQHFVATLSLT
jgi:dephospho-CoA kinase